MFLHEASQPAALLWGRAIPIPVDFWYSVWESQQMCKELTMVLEMFVVGFYALGRFGPKPWLVEACAHAQRFPVP